MGNPLTIEKNSIAFPAANLFASTTSCNGPSRAQRLKQRCFHLKIYGCVLSAAIIVLLMYLNKLLEINEILFLSNNTLDKRSQSDKNINRFAKLSESSQIQMLFI